MRTDWYLTGDLKKFLAVIARVGGDAAQLLLVKEMPLVIERGDRREVDAGNREDSAAIERSQRRRHQLAGGSKENRGVERRRRTFIRAAGPLGAKLVGQILMNSAAAHHEDAASPMLQ